MAFIVDTLSPSEHRIQLGFECFIRTMSIGANWQKLRIGFRVAINDTYVPMLAAKIVAGVSQGPIPFDSYDIPDFNGGVLYSTSYTTGAQWNRVTNAGVVCYTQSSGTAIRKQGEIITGTTGSSSSTTYLSAQPGLSRTVLLSTITKTGTTYNVHTSGSSSGADVSRAAFIATMEDEANTPLNMGTLSGSSSVTGPLNHSFDTVQIRWHKSLPTLEISDIMAVRYY